MKIVQSLWSRPSQPQGGFLHYRGRWPEPRHFWYSWVLSVCWAHKHYGDVELYTDNEGARWLVDKLDLPFSAVSTALEELDAPPSLWAWGKVITYSLQEEPFFHIDSDVYLTGRLPQRYEQADYVGQFIEEIATHPEFVQVYDVNVLAIENVIPYLPPCWEFTRRRKAINCGLFGGRNLDAIHQYTDDAIEMLSDPRNAESWKFVLVKNGLNCVIEQQLAWCSAHEQNVPVTTLFEMDDFVTEDALRKKALELNFNHACVNGKNEAFGGHLGERIEAEFPDQFRRLMELFPPARAKLALPTSLAADEVIDPQRATVAEVNTFYMSAQRPRKAKRR